MSHGPDSSTTTPGCVRTHRPERRSFGLTSLEVGGWRCLRGVGGAWRQDAERWLNWGAAVRSRGVLAEPVALQLLEVAQRRRSQRQGGQKAPSTRRCIKTGYGPYGHPTHRSESTQHQKVH